jgi:superfamily II DNA or RNA helicase
MPFETPVPLLDHVQHLFPAWMRERGREYFENGRVTVTSGGREQVKALVSGEQQYTATVKRNPRSVSMRCSCPHYPKAGVCKHLWALLLAAADQGLLSDTEASGESLLVPPRASSGLPVGPAEWEQRFRRLVAGPPRERAVAADPTAELVYVAERGATLEEGALVVLVGERRPKKAGGWGRIQTLPGSRVRQLASAGRRDPEALHWLVSSRDPSALVAYPDQGRFRLLPPLAAHILPALCATSRCFLRVHSDDPDEALLGPIRWDAGPPWELAITVRSDEPTDEYVVDGSLHRGTEDADLRAPRLLASGVAFFESEAGRLDIGDGYAWARELRRGSIRVPRSRAARLQELLAEVPRAPRLSVPPELQLAEVALKPQPQLAVSALREWGWQADLHGLAVSFAYDGLVVQEHDPRERLPDGAHARVILRDFAAEEAAHVRLRELGAQAEASSAGAPALSLRRDRLSAALRTLILEGWQVTAEGRVYRVASGLRMNVRSGVDWFDLQGEVTFADGSSIPIGAVFSAIRNREQEVELGPGQTVILPDEWAERYGLLAQLGEVGDEGIRFGKGQVGLLDALLAAQPETDVDAAFARARDKLRKFDRIKPAKEPRGFKGELRGYQREGLGWLQFLREFGFGGCLADDMGLGKTVQVLALLQSRKSAAARPSLVVVPRSVIFNWLDEARRFTPGLRLLDYSRAGRGRDAAVFADVDVVLTTYGTLRRDASHLKDFRFDYVILDEAQAVKNAQSETAKAARLLQSDHRLALSGTPIQNHLGELWSLFEFLNPGMLGRAAVFQEAMTAQDPDTEHLAAGLRPFILRRTKEQVAKDLPVKTEQTLYCDLEGEQLKLYRALRDDYRSSLLARLDRDGLAKSRMHVLEALLRLRQAACHPALVPVTVGRPRPAGAASAKVDALLPLLEEVVEEGHKALVFSQFTSFLGLITPELEARGIVYEYLDGQTRDREARVKRFQEDPDCRVFVISLKAGGLGLNLTAAEYVFILDPWWNPAAEAQAVDRAHRIGQTRAVFAYRLIARGTVEEKVLELQESKRQLAEAILTENNSLIRTLQRDDIERLLS